MRTIIHFIMGFVFVFTYAGRTQQLDLVWVTGNGEVPVEAKKFRYYQEGGKIFFPSSSSKYAIAMDLRTGQALGYIPLRGPNIPEKIRAGGWLNDSIVYLRSWSDHRGTVIRTYNVLQAKFLDSVFLERSKSYFHENKYFIVHPRLKLVLVDPQFYTAEDSIRVWDLTTGKYLYGIPNRVGASVLCLRNDSDEMVLAGQYRIQVVNLQDGQEIDRLNLPFALEIGGWTEVAMSQGAKRIVAANILWDRESGGYVELDGNVSTISPDGRYVAEYVMETLGKREIRRLDLETGETKSLRVYRHIRVLYSSVTGDTIYGDGGNALCVFDFKNDTVYYRDLWSHAIPEHAEESGLLLELSPRGRYLRIQRSNGQLLILDVRTGSAVVRTVSDSWKQYESWLQMYPHAIAFSWDDQFVAFAGFPTSTEVTVFSLPEMQVVSQFQTDTSVTAIAFDPLRYQIATGEHDGKIHIRHFNGNEIDVIGRNVYDPQPMPPRYPEVIWFLRYCFGGNYLVGMDESEIFWRAIWTLDIEERSFSVWEGITGEFPEILEMSRFNGRYFSKFYKDQHTLLRFHCSGEEERRYTIPSDLVDVVSDVISSDGRYVLGVEGDSVVVVVDLETQRIVARSRTLFQVKSWFYESGPWYGVPRFVGLYWNASGDKVAGSVIVTGGGLKTLFLLNVPQFVTSVPEDNMEIGDKRIPQSGWQVSGVQDQVYVYNILGERILTVQQGYARDIEQLRAKMRNMLSPGIYFAIFPDGNGSRIRWLIIGP